MIESLISGLLIVMTLQLLIRSFIEKKRRTKNINNMVFLSDIALYIGALGSVIATAVCCYTGFINHDLILTIGFAVFSMLGISLLLAWKNCCITFGKEDFTHKNFLGISRKYDYNQVTAFKGNPAASDVVIYIENKKIRIDKLAVNKEVFLKLLRKKYRTVNAGDALPQIYKSESDTFNGNVNNPHEFIIVFALITLLMTAGTIFVALAMKPVSENDTTHLTVTFESCEIDRHDLVLKSTQYEHSFVIDDYEKYVTNSEQLISLCDNKTSFDVWVQEISPDKNSYYAVCQIAESNNVFFSFEDNNKQISDTALIVLLILGFWESLVIVCFIFTIIIGRNPHRFKPWFIRLFFKKDAINV